MASSLERHGRCCDVTTSKNTDRSSTTTRSCYITLRCAMLYVGGRIVLRLIWNNVSNALPKLLSKDEPNFKISLNYLDIDNFHDFKPKICTGYIDDVFTNDVC